MCLERMSDGYDLSAEGIGFKIMQRLARGRYAPMPLSLREWLRYCRRGQEVYDVPRLLIGNGVLYPNGLHVFCRRRDACACFQTARTFATNIVLLLVSWRGQRARGPWRHNLAGCWDNYEVLVVSHMKILRELDSSGEATEPEVKK